MGEINIVKTIKMIHLSTIVMVKIGNFYHVYGKDSYIFSYFLNYKITEKNGIPHCGFPITSISKVENILEKNKINYICVDKRNNYDEEYRYINKQENKYDKFFDKAEKTTEISLKIQNINKILTDKKQDKNIMELLNQIEKVIYNERRKI